MQIRQEVNTFSYSQLASWLRCRYKWYVSFGLGLKPRIERPKPHFGHMIHVGVAAAFHAQDQGKDPKKAIRRAVTKLKEEYWTQNTRTDTKTGEIFVDLYDEEIQTVEERTIRAIKLSYRAFKWIDKRFEPIKIDGVLAVEYQVELEIEFGVPKYFGKIDLAAKEKKTGYVWLIDLKVREQIQPDEDEELNIQFASYQNALAEKGIKTIGSMALQIWFDMPRQPELLANGKGMKRSDIRTDWKTYKKALLKHGFNPDDYQDMEEKLREKKFFHPSRDFRSPKTVKRFWDEILMPVAMELANPIKSIHRNMNAWNCKGCEHREVCQAGLRGGDTDYIFENDYVRNDYAHQYEEEVDPEG